MLTNNNVFAIDLYFDVILIIQVITIDFQIKSQLLLLIFKLLNKTNVDNLYH